MKKAGFTLIELLVVIAIIGILSTATVVNLNVAKAKARDARRLSDMKNILLAIQIYYENNGQYPPVGGVFACGCIAGVGCLHTGYSGYGENFLPSLVIAGIMGKVPVDPIINETNHPGDYCYGYFRFGAGVGGCDISKGPYFVLAIHHLETWNGSGQYPSSPGWQCPGGYDWSDFDWVAGGYES